VKLWSEVLPVGWKLHWVSSSFSSAFYFKLVHSLVCIMEPCQNARPFDTPKSSEGLLSRFKALRISGGFHHRVVFWSVISCLHPIVWILQ